MKHKLRLSISIFIVLLTLGVFSYYLNHHYYLITKILHTPPLTIIGLLLLYTLYFVSLVFILLASLRICKKELPIKDNLLLNAYSYLVNFFVPGQGGIVVRGAYLKKVKNLAVRNFIFASLLYFAFYAIISAVLLLSSTKHLWLSIVIILLLICFCIGVIQIYKKRQSKNKFDLELSPINLIYLFTATLIQACIQISIYALELHDVNSHISIHQVITYTGVANFALFVAVTPGAIGIREAFLLFSHHLTHISNSNVVGANIIDRGVFIVFLGCLALITLIFHTRSKFKVKQTLDSVDELYSESN